jgi:hypothetical protein
VSALVESGEAADGEEITNKVPKVEEGWKKLEAGLETARMKFERRTHEMCAIHADFKHFRGVKPKNFGFTATSCQSCGRVTFD